MHKLRILMIGSDETWSLEKYYRIHLSKLSNVTLDFCPIQSIFYAEYNKSVLHKLLYKIGLSSLDGQLDQIARNKVMEFNPSIVWVFKGMELRPSFFRWVKDRGIKLVNYNPDNPFVFSGKGSGNNNVTGSIGLFDLHLTYDKAVKQKMEAEYKIPCKILPFGFELKEPLFHECVAQQEIIKVCFLGNPDAGRLAFIEELAESLPLDVYGHGWSRLTKHHNITCFGAVYGDEFWKVLRRYRVQLNLMRAHNPNSHNMRSFEVPGVGGIGLLPDTPDHREYFEIGKELFVYKNDLDCKTIAQHLLELPAREAFRIRDAARQRSLQSGYTYEGRTRQVVKMFEEFMA